MTEATTAAPKRPHPRLATHDELTETNRAGSGDQLTIVGVLALLPQLQSWSGLDAREQTRRLCGAEAILTWLLTFPGQGWQQRWQAAGADADTRWIAAVPFDQSRSAAERRVAITGGINGLLLCRVVLPTYQFLAAFRPLRLYENVRQVFQPELFARMQQTAAAAGMRTRDIAGGLAVISKIVLHTGHDPNDLTVEDIYRYRNHGVRLDPRGHSPYGVHAAWELLRHGGVLAVTVSLTTALRRGQRPTAELVDSYQIQCQPIRDVLVRYLNERRPALDYSSFRTLAGTLAGSFWRNIEEHHPGLDTLSLPSDVTEAWRQRMLFTTKPGREGRPRKSYLELMIRVRAFYLDIAEWALEDPSWTPWAVASPIRRADTEGIAAHHKKVTSQMHQRIRERLPQLPILVETAERHRAEQAALLAAANATAVGDSLDHEGTRWRRVSHKTHGRFEPDNHPAVLVENIATRERVDVTRGEAEAFWAWAVIETLRHTGVRVEELLEITHLALVSYRLPDTGEILPLLQIVPSKSNEERLLLVTPELAHVLATIINRLRSSNDGTIPLVGRYDEHERVTGPPLPHLFQHRHGWRNQVFSTSTVKSLINGVLTRTGLRDNARQPLRCTPHDFRRMFATDAVTGGLPVHIAARLLGHVSLTTTQAYLAVFQDDLVRSYRSFVDARRAVRPAAEYREPTNDEWREFQQHFELRKLELGTCGRPYGTPCKHEHACVRCSMLRVDPKQRNRLIEIVRNLSDRIDEARANGWFGEVQGLQISLDAARAKLVSLDRTSRSSGSITKLGIPKIRHE
jgi:integrase